MSAVKSLRPVRNPDHEIRPDRARDRSPASPSLSGTRPRSEMSHMYEMYAYNRAEDHEDEATEAVQMALDRRDNGGAPQSR
ncbi:hypothetical protein GCM10027203_40740 [Nonomuraea fastidiosa]